MYSVLNALSEYTYFKKHYFIFFLLVFKIAETLQCILKVSDKDTRTIVSVFIVNFEHIQLINIVFYY